MTNLQRIEKEIQELPPQDLSKFRAWFEKFDADQWDKKFEHDVKSGKLDSLAQNAINDFKNGKYKKI